MHIKTVVAFMKDHRCDSSFFVFYIVSPVRKLVQGEENEKKVKGKKKGDLSVRLGILGRIFVGGRDSQWNMEAGMAAENHFFHVSSQYLCRQAGNGSGIFSGSAKVSRQLVSPFYALWFFYFWRPFVDRWNASIRRRDWCNAYHVHPSVWIGWRGSGGGTFDAAISSVSANHDVLYKSGLWTVHRNMEKSRDLSKRSRKIYAPDTALRSRLFWRDFAGSILQSMDGEIVNKNFKYSLRGVFYKMWYG